MKEVKIQVKHPSGVVGKKNKKCLKSMKLSQKVAWVPLALKKAAPSLYAGILEISQTAATEVHERNEGLLTPARLFGENAPLPKHLPFPLSVGVLLKYALVWVLFPKLLPNASFHFPWELFPKEPLLAEWNRTLVRCGTLFNLTSLRES